MKREAYMGHMGCTTEALTRGWRSGALATGTVSCGVVGDRNDITPLAISWTLPRLGSCRSSIKPPMDGQYVRTGYKRSNTTAHDGPRKIAMKHGLISKTWPVVGVFEAGNVL